MISKLKKETTIGNSIFRSTVDEVSNTILEVSQSCHCTNGYEWIRECEYVNIKMVILELVMFERPPTCII